MLSLLSQLKISVLDSHRKEVKQKYSDALKGYVTRYFGQPLQKLNVSEIIVEKVYNKTVLRVVLSYSASRINKLYQIVKPKK